MEKELPASTDEYSGRRGNPIFSPVVRPERSRVAKRKTSFIVVERQVAEIQQPAQYVIMVLGYCEHHEKKLEVGSELCLGRLFQKDRPRRHRLHPKQLQTVTLKEYLHFPLVPNQPCHILRKLFKCQWGRLKAHHD